MQFKRIAAVVAAFTLLSATAAFGDNLTQIDGSTTLNGNDLSYAATANQNNFACSSRGTAAQGSARVSRTGSGTSFAANAELTITGTSPTSGISVAQTTTMLPNTWSGGSQHTFNFQTTVASTVADGTHVVTLRAENSAGQFLTGTFNVIVECAAPAGNAAPVITAFTATATAACTVSASVAWTDADAGDTHSVTFEWDDNSADTVVNPATSPTVESHIYGAAGTYEISVTVSDGTDNDTDTESFTTKNSASALMEPIKTDGLSMFKINQSIPVKITVTDCGGDAVENLSPVVALKKIDSNPDAGEPVDGGVNDAPTNGKLMAWNGEHYHYVLSTKNSQFNNNKALTAGTYEIKISHTSLFAATSEEFQLRK